MGFSSLAKLSDKSHYNYNEADIIKIKDLLLQNLEEALQKFNKEIRLYKEEDINTVQDHLIKIKEENLRLENENKRLNFVITNYIRENELLKIDEVKEILNTKNIKENFKKSQYAYFGFGLIFAYLFVLISSVDTVISEGLFFSYLGVLLLKRPRIHSQGIIVDIFAIGMVFYSLCAFLPNLPYFFQTGELSHGINMVSV